MNSLLDRVTKPGLSKRIRRRLQRGYGRSLGAQYLDTYGWQGSSKSHQPIDRDDNPVPWYTFPAFDVLRRVVNKDQRVFEYGCGNSTLWWAANASSVVSVEHHSEWAAKIAARAPNNATVLFKPQSPQEATRSAVIGGFFSKSPKLPLSGFPDLDIEHGLLCEGFDDYVLEIAKHDPFDVVVVDGMARSLTAWIAAHHLTPDGFIVFDNSDRWQYNSGYEALYDLGFGRVDFWGLGPVNTSTWCTSIFYRTPKWSKPLITLDPTVWSSLDYVIAARQ